MSEESREIAIPLDSDGFLRRECPTCEREFKWRVSERESEPVPVGGYFCPYCAIQAPTDSWSTSAQIELAKNTVMREILGPELSRMARDLRSTSRGGLVELDMQYQSPPALDPIVEADDMRRVDFRCHPAEPVKVLDAWAREIHCLICATPAESS